MSQTRETQVVSICEQATRHNDGQTILSFGSSFVGDEVTVELASWPRMQEAASALRQWGYEVRDDGVRTLTARPSVALVGAPE